MAAIVSRSHVLGNLCAAVAGKLSQVGALDREGEPRKKLNGTTTLISGSKQPSIPRRMTGLTKKGREAMLVFPLYSNSLFLISLLQESTDAFNDLGKLLLVGAVTALLLAIGFTLVRLRLRDKKPQTSNFISISSAPENNREKSSEAKASDRQSV